MELKSKSSCVQTNTKSNNQNVNSMNINQGGEGKADQPCTFQSCTISSPSATNSNSSNSTNHLPSNSHLDGHLDNRPENAAHPDGHLDAGNQPVNGSAGSLAGSSGFKIEFNEANCMVSSPSYAGQQISSPACLNQTPSSTPLMNNSEFNGSFGGSGPNSQLANDLENNPHLLNLSRSIGGSQSNLANCMTANMVNCMTGGDAIPITNLPNGGGNPIAFNCHQASFFTANQPPPPNQAPDDQQFDAFGPAPSACLAKTTKETCATCSSQILDRYLLKVNGASYHEKCVFCCCCGGILNSVCYQRNAKLYCKQDYLR